MSVSPRAVSRKDRWFKDTYWKMYDDLQMGEDGHSVSAVKVVTWNEPLLRTDGQGRVVMPECFVVEAFLQMVAIMFTVREHRTVRAAMLLKVKSARFHRTPRLGDRLLYEARVRARHGRSVVVEARATLEADGSRVADAELLETLIPRSAGRAARPGRRGPALEEP
jgi:3-hydroxymyristoyl/3-hydroxydecanoyl-(acyl carrier protein) dehydratase